MAYFHGEDYREIEQSARGFCESEVRNNFQEFIKAKSFSRDVFEKMGKLNFTGAMIPEAYGGAGMSMRQYAVLMESMACYGGGSIALTLTAHHSLAATHILYAGTEDQKLKFLPGLASGKLIGAWCLTEPGAGSDAFGEGVRTTASLTDGGWIINGPKHFITNGSMADVYVVIAKIIPLTSDKKTDSYGVFIVPRDSKGFINCRQETYKLGMHASDTSAVIFEDVQVDFGAKMEGDGRHSTKKVLNSGRVGISALACGLMRSALGEAREYAKVRKTFGKPISEYQGVSFPIADAFSELRSSWAITEVAAIMADQGKLTSRLAAETKLKTTKSSFESCFTALQTFGGQGYMMDRATQDFADSVLLRIGEGTDNMQRLTIARALFST